MANFSAARQRGIYDMIKREYAGIGTNPIIQPGFLSVDLQLQSGKGTYPVYVNANNQGAANRTCNILLNQNDNFCITHIGLFLKQESALTPGKAALQCYPNATVFGADEAGYYLFADMESLYNSNLTVKVGNTTFGQNIDLNGCRVVRTTLQTSATNKSERDQFDGYVETEPYITLDGFDKNDITFNPSTYPGQLIQLSTAGTGNTNYAVIRFFGFLVAGVR